jgi:hypothetical protein
MEDTAGSVVGFDQDTGINEHVFILLPVSVLVEGAETRRLCARELLHRVVVVYLALLQIFLGQRHVVVSFFLHKPRKTLR